MRALEFIATIRGGVIVPPQGLSTFMHAHEEKEVRIILSENTKRRSLNQNSFYWGVIIPLVRQFRTGNGDTVSADQVHEDLLNEFSPTMVSMTLTGKVFYRHKRSHEMSKPEMSDYIAAITARLAEFGHHIIMQGEVV